MQNQNDNLLDVLTRKGVLLNVSIRFWRAHKKLKPADIGLDPDNVSNRLFSLGHKKLLPPESLKLFQLIESRAHALVEDSTFPFLGNIARFLPNSKLETVTDKLRELEAEFRTAQVGFERNYSNLREKACREWRKAAVRLVNDPDELLSSIEAAFPHDVGRYFGFDVQLFQIHVPKSISTDLVNLGEQQEIVRSRQKAAQEAARKIREGTETFVADCVATMRQQAAELCEEMLKSMKAGKTQGVHQKTLNRMVNFVDKFKSLNFADDRQMEEQLEAVRKQFLSKTAEEYRDSTYAQAKLRKGIQKLADTARDLARQDTQEIVERFGQMGRRKINLAA